MTDGPILCAVDDLPDPAAESYGWPGRRDGRDVLVVRDGAGVRGFVDACPHRGTPLGNPLGRVLDADGRHLVCSTHGARFRLADGVCVAGPCVGARLSPVTVVVADGMVVVVAQAGAATKV